MDLLSFINFYLLPGIILGAIYALGAVGITLVFSILRFAHLAHGDITTFGAFIVLSLVASIGLNPWVALVPAMVVTALLCVLIDKVFYEAFTKRPKIILVMSSLGLALMVRAIVQVIWGVDTQSYTQGIVRPHDIGGVRIRDREIFTLIATIVIMLSLSLFLAKTKWGKAMRAMSDNPDLAKLCGINNRHVTMITWAIVGMLCAASGFMLGLNTEVNSMMGWHMLLPMFAGAILGGVGRIDGAVLGGMVVGIAEELSVLLIAAQYKSAMGFFILLLILVVRPTGILRGKLL